VLWQRALTAIVGIPVLLTLTYLGGWYLGIPVILLSLLGLREFFRLAAGSGLKPCRWIGYLAAVALLATAVAGGAKTTEPSYLLPQLLALAVGAALVEQFLRPAPPGAVANAGAVVLGVLYLPFLLSYLVKLRGLFFESMFLFGSGLVVERGACWVVLLIFTCWAEDTAAYGIGKALGRHKLCPKISPGKTVEGSAAGWLGAVVVAAGLGGVCGLPLIHGVALGAIIGVVGQLGDLSKSIMKRQAGVKDSGTILPGHGGVLDRFDSLLFSAPAAYYYIAWIWA